MILDRLLNLLATYTSFKHRRMSCQSDEETKSENSGPADFERAIKATGYGKFNYLFLLAMLPASFASIFSSSVMSYVLPSAECDLQLTMFDKGLLNSMTFAGMISTAFFWGCMADTFGRRKLMFYGYLVTGLLSLATCFSHSSSLLILFKFFDGVIISGPYAALMSYLAEIHDEVHRSRSYMWLGVFFSLGNIFLPCVAWLILPQKWDITFFNQTININSWRVFLAICSLPEFLACAAIFAFPESPRFLILKGRHDEAMNVFKKIYSLNTGKDPDTYPIKSLENEYSVKPSEECIQDKLCSSFRQMKPLFLPPNIFKLILISTIQLGATLGSNSLRLWMPQLFVMIESYKRNLMKNDSHISGVQPSFCYMLVQEESYLNSTRYVNKMMNNDTFTCVPAELNAQVFINSIVIAVTGVIGYTLAGTLISVIGKKKLMISCFIIAAACCGSLYWAEDTSGILGLSSVFVAMSSIGGATVINVIVDNFPTCLRTMAVSITMMMGRLGAVIGNLLFPVLFNLSCLEPFIMIGLICFVCAFLVVMLPHKKKCNDKTKDIV
ncbi:synaptic vesicle glycoprotein 2B-like isoform X1 [Nylanderia fulva]|uniref:synaptic vesicle glycoprotein 2B-like isoform X1 n=2 Tax=Nylanderia fulva TaxID=613905 RepID=UPI0010FB2B7E|nr:synaptic vesicle glycoprotein 2B-like isoform X1 [Nylanderia fulva]XP_029154918.1 synaptic vesicle glycoprotein 2B-like isoform X1 [Nylanderia fulva]XP_029154919.1 synaptic vesicle glycoprotein 2B-like isoform X1 [Nylanderia fulva]